MINSNAVYRQCADDTCPAWRLELPHSHYEESTPEQVRAFVERWQETKPELVKVLPQLDETIEESSVKAWLSLPLEGEHSIMQCVGEYITWVETGMTRDVCKCERIEHPVRGNIRSGDTALDCPAHSKEGLVLGFIEWLRRGDKPPQRVSCTMGSISSIDGKRTCCQMRWPDHTEDCPERKCDEHGYSSD